MLALAVAFSAGAAATPGGGAKATAAKKGKRCKKGKHHHAAQTSKKKRKGCKKRTKPADTAPGAETQAPPSIPAAPAPAPVPAAKNWTPADGNYADGAAGIDVAIRKGATEVDLVFEGGKGTCVPAILAVKGATTTATPDSFTASGEAQVPVEDLKMKITIVIATDYSYTATVDSSTESCDKPGVVFKGKLKSVA